MKQDTPILSALIFNKVPVFNVIFLTISGSCTFIMAY